MKDLPYFESVDEAQYYLDQKRQSAAIHRPKVYSLSTTIPAGGNDQGEIKIENNGDFLMESIVIQFNFDENDLPKLLIGIIDTSNQDKTIVPQKTPASLLASIGKTGNQLILPMEFKHYLQSTGSLSFNFTNLDLTNPVTVDIAIIGEQFSLMGKVK